MSFFSPCQIICSLSSEFDDLCALLSIALFYLCIMTLMHNVKLHKKCLILNSNWSCQSNEDSDEYNKYKCFWGENLLHLIGMGALDFNQMCVQVLVLCKY